MDRKVSMVLLRSIQLSQNYVKMLKSSSVFETEHDTQPLVFKSVLQGAPILTDRGLHIPKFKQEP